MIKIMKKIFKNYGLTIVLTLLFLGAWIFQGVFQYQHEYSEALQEGKQYTMEDFGNSFLASTFENWQSEFLQLGSMVILTSFLIHKGSPQSKDSEEEMMQLLRQLNTNMNRTPSKGSK